MLQRYIDRGVRAWNYARGNPVVFLWNLVRWDVHPFYRSVIAATFNRRHDGSQIYGTFDGWKIPLKIAEFLVLDIIRMGEVLERYFDEVGPEVEAKYKKDARRHINRKFGSVLKFFLDNPIFAVASGHFREPADVQFRARMRGKKRAFRYEQKQYFMEHGRINKRWLRNYLSDMRKEFRRYEKKQGRKRETKREKRWRKRMEKSQKRRRNKK
jgi:hypothetical protein